jgi:ssDNA-binding Zn-finger/Zn-ribbon topoisomerase 1
MASQYGVKKKYTSHYENESPKTGVECPLCHVIVVPRGITSTMYHSVTGGESHCPNCGKILTRTSPLI